jgi:hypothetical protein
MEQRWADERQRQRGEREALYRERRESIERRRRESIERQQQLAAEERHQREAALRALWGRRADQLAAEDAVLAAAMMEAPTDVEEEAPMEEEEAEAEETEVEDDDDDEFEWSDDDGPHPDETADQQRALVESFESEKKLQDDARALEEAHIRRAIELSLQAAQQGTAEDARRERHRLATAERKERRRAQEELRRRGGDDGAGPSNAPPGGQ